MLSYYVWWACKAEQIICHILKINRQEAQITSLQNQNKQLTSLPDSKALVNAISQAVTTSLKLSSQPTNKSGAASNGTGFGSKPYLRKPRIPVGTRC